ncbi:MAG: MmcQ/YjbR family DNA-binding protein [Clostridia bacterium]|nr:MmcQ/YjbR family DNA-binding protein [Clostridia bacterium]
MDGKILTSYCLSKKGATEDYPFGPDVLVIKVSSKMFALISMKANKLNISLKCDPFLADNLRQQYASVTPGYHLNKKHWNTIVVDGSISEQELYWMIDHSYELVLNSLTKIEREAI